MNKYKIIFPTENEALICGVKFDGLQNRILNYLSGIAFAASELSTGLEFKPIFSDKTSVIVECNNPAFLFSLYSELRQYGIKISEINS